MQPDDTSSSSLQKSRLVHPGAKMRGPRKVRCDAGKIQVTERDEYALPWIGYQYGIRLDQLQRLLGRYPGPGAVHQNRISEGAARDVVTRWQRAGWVQTARLRAHEPFYVWLTKAGLRKLGLAYPFRDLQAFEWSDLAHLYAINQVRLHLEEAQIETQWLSQRQFLHAWLPLPGEQRQKPPDALLSQKEECIAIIVELSVKPSSSLSKQLITLVRGEASLRWNVEFGTQEPDSMEPGMRLPYTQLRCYAPIQVCAKIRRVRARLVERGMLSPEEAARIRLYDYPLAQTEQEQAQEAGEEEARHNLGDDVP